MTGSCYTWIMIYLDFPPSHDRGHSSILAGGRQREVAAAHLLVLALKRMERIGGALVPPTWRSADHLLVQAFASQIIKYEGKISV